jgi:ABC-type Fe3+-hydroxamate transport system substrate-binding protein
VEGEERYGAVESRHILGDSQGLRRIFCETLGTELELPDRVERIVSFSPAVTETLAFLGVEDSLVGVSAFCAKPESIRGKRKVGSYNTVDREVLDELRPEIIFTATGYQRDFAVKLGKELPVYAVELPVSVTGIIDMVVKLGLIVNEPDRATKISRNLLGVLAGLKSVQELVRVYLEVDLGGPVSFGAYSYITAALRLLGVQSLYGDRACEWLTPDLDWVRSQEPDVIVYEAKMFKRFGEEDLAGLLQGRDWQNLKAVKSHRLFVTPGPLDFVAHHGPSFITDTMPWLEERFNSSRA